MKYQIENKREWITKETWEGVQERSEQNYSIQNVKGSVNEFKRLTTPRIMLDEKNARRDKRAYAD